MLEKSSERVPESTAPQINEDIRQATIDNIVRYAPGGQPVIQWRLDALDREWDIERAIEANASSFALLGLLLATIFSWWFLLLPAVVAAFLLQHALQGWCPPVPILRRLGFRTRKEIDYERYALKALRGDFRRISAGPPEAVTAVQAEEAFVTAVQ